jgi:hypothetical protein
MGRGQMGKYLPAASRRLWRTMPKKFPVIRENIPALIQQICGLPPLWLFSSVAVRQTDISGALCSSWRTPHIGQTIYIFI